MLDKICTGDLPLLEKEIKEHIRNQNKKVNFNLAVNEKKKTIGHQQKKKLM
ncbi:hypothetical protein [Providencia rettgeri]|uniref:hypothetical protein n=1 Tax=Providencia rettgeri TaxID=587 RepID=UPI001B35FCA6|nr:hypothetical protein [Providencia rettgeri]MBQ0367002.1 hypothetical protein [Providencia rettgeri]